MDYFLGVHLMCMHGLVLYTAINIQQSVILF